MTIPIKLYESPVGWMQETDDDGYDDENYVKASDMYSWNGLMSILDAIYPASVFTGVSGDPGPVIIAKLREIDAIRAATDDEHTVRDEDRESQ